MPRGANSDRDHPSWHDLRAAARAVRESPRARVVIDTARPRDVTWLFRSRASLIILLYLAAVEGRLVWQAPTAFAVLQQPVAGPDNRPPLPLLASLLRMLDRHWGLAMFVWPVAVSLLTAFLLALFREPELVALTFVLPVPVYVCVVLGSMLVRQVGGRRQTAGKAAADDLVIYHWTLSLVHQEDEERTEALIGQVRDRIRRLISAQVQGAAQSRGGRAAEVQVVDTVVCLAGAATTEPVLRYIEWAADVYGPSRANSEFVLMMPDSRPDTLVDPQRLYVPFFRLYVFAIAAMLFILPTFVASAEQQACAGGDCRAALITYGKALHWLAYQFIWQSASGLRPVSSESTTFGFAVHFLLPMAVVVGLVAAHRVNSDHRDAVQRGREARHKMLRPTRVMIVTVKLEERDAVIDAAQQITHRPPTLNFSGALAVHELGIIRETRVCVVQAGESGSTTPAGVAMTTTAGIRQWQPDYLIITGFCYGLRPEAQSVCDVLVSQRIRDLDLAALDDDGTGVVVVRDRGENLQPSHVLLDRCLAAQSDWDVAPVHFGEMLSWNKKVNSTLVVDRLRKEYPRALGGDMEGAGFHSAARRGDVHWILVKSICDFGHDTTREHQPAAAATAAAFIMHAISIGALRNRPSEMLR